MSAERQLLWKPALQLFSIAALALLLGACGGKSSMEGAGDEEQVGAVKEDATQIQGTEESVGFDEAERARKMEAQPKGSTKSGPGKLTKYTTQAGDTLWKLAERKDIYGSGWLYPIILKANKDIIKDPKNLPAGLKLKIPRDLSSVEEEVAKEEAMTGQDMDSSPLASAQPTPAPAKKLEKSKKGGSGLLWLLLILLAVLAFLWMRMKKKQQQEETAPAA